MTDARLTVPRKRRKRSTTRTITQNVDVELDEETAAQLCADITRALEAAGLLPIDA